MFRRLIILMLFLGTACQSGLLPCPRVKTVRAKKTVIHRHFLESEASLSAKAGDEEREGTKTHARAKSNVKVINNVTPEEWDCPRPGKRKYMPKTVKENIRRNLEKINSPSKDETDSLTTAPLRDDSRR